MMKIDALSPTSSDREFVDAWMDDIKTAITTMAGPREQIVKMRLQRQLDVLQRLTQTCRCGHAHAEHVPWEDFGTLSSLMPHPAIGCRICYQRLRDAEPEPVMCIEFRPARGAADSASVS